MSLAQITLTLTLAICLTFTPALGQCQHGSKDSGRTFPQLGTESFKAELAGWMLLANNTMVMREHWSKESGKGAVFYNSPGRDTFYITFKDGARWIGENGVCFGGMQEGGGLSKMMHMVKGALDPTQATFVEDVTLAGIPTERWRVCQRFSPGELADISAEAALDIYIARGKEWNMYTGDQTKDVPLRLVVRIYRGVKMIDHYIYDFTHFKQMEYDSDKFQADLEPPLGVMCRGMDEGKTQPGLPESSTLRQEAITSFAGHPLPPTSSQVILDQKFQVFQRDIAAGLLIRDFNGGAAYAIFWNNKRSSTRCVVTPINTYSDKVPINTAFSQEDHYVTMDSVNDYFFLSGDFTYSGEYNARGIPCDVYTHVIKNYGLGDTKATVLLYFSKPDVAMFGSYASAKDGRLVRIEVRNEDGDKLFNIYDLDLYNFNTARDEPYDISACFSRENRLEFAMIFEIGGGEEALTPIESRGIERATRQMIASECNVDIVRVHIEKAVQLGGNVGLIGKIFARPLAGTYFNKYYKRSFGSGADAKARIVSVTSDVGTMLECSNLAMADPDVTDADFCPTRRECTLYGPSGKHIELVEDLTCAHLTKITGYHTRTTMQEAYDVLEKLVNEGKFEAVVQRQKTYKAIDIKLTSHPEDSKHAYTLLDKFRRSQDIAMTTTKDDMKLHLNLHDCALQCLHEPRFPCEAFSHCQATSQCELHGTYLKGDTASASSSTSDTPPNFISKNGCDTYVRSYLHNFEHLPGVARSAVAAVSEKEYGNVADPEVCAKVCMERDDVQCESFDFCKSGDQAGKCILRRYHARDDTTRTEEVADGGKVEINCSHYSRNYFWDYTRRDGVTMFPVRTTAKNVASQEACAFQCSADPNCDTFHFCDSNGQTECQFLDTSGGKPSPGDFVPKPHCSTFLQKESADVLSRAAQLSQGRGNTPGKSGYSRGAMGGLAVAMILLGFGLCFLVLYGLAVYQRRQVPNGDNMKTSLNNDQVEDESKY